MTALLLLLKASRKNVLVSILTGIIAGASFSGLVALIKLAIDTELEHFYGLLSAFILCWASYGFFSILSAYFLEKLAQKTIFDLRLSLSEKILSTPLKVIEEAGSQIFVVLTEDVNTLSYALQQIPGAVTAIATVLGCFLCLLWVSPLLFSTLMTVLLVSIPLYVLPLRKFHRYISDLRQGWNKIFDKIYSLNHGIKELLLNHNKKQSFLKDELYPACETQMQQAIKGKTYESLISRWGDLILLSGLGFATFTLPKYGYINFQTLSEFIFVFLFSLPPLLKVINFVNFLSRVKVSTAQIDAVFSLLSENRLVEFKSQVLNSNNLSLKNQPADRESFLTLENVTYSYYCQEREYAFNFGPVSLSFPRSGVFFVTGGNGSGKSTFVKLLCGLYTPDLGRIYLDGLKITDCNQEAYRQKFSVVFSDFYLFDKLLGIHQEGLDNEAKDYLVKLELSHKLSIKDGEFSSIKLSQGQRKRLALLTAFLEGKEIYIFDEWASDQDPYFKKIFYYEILEELKQENKLIFVISHDDAYYHLADQVIKLTDGKVV